MTKFIPGRTGLGNRPSRSFNDVTAFLKQAELFESVIIVKTIADLSGDLDSTKIYMLDGEIAVGDTSIMVPEDGISISGLNGARDIAMLSSSSDNHTMFISPDGTPSGNILLSSITISTSGTGSKVFDVDNEETSMAIDLEAVNFVNCTSLGDITSYRQMLCVNVGFINISDGFTFHGTMSGGVAIVTSIAISSATAFTLMNEGTDLLIQGSIRSDVNFLNVHEDSVLCDFTPSDIVNDGEFGLENVRTTALNPLPNFPSTDVKARFRNCLGIPNTYVGGAYTVTTVTNNVIADSGVAVKMAGTTVESNLAWFSRNANNSLIFNSDLEIDAEIKGSLSFDGTNNRVVGVQIVLWDDSESEYVDIGPLFTGTMNGGGAGNRAENITFFGYTTMTLNDRIEMWVSNETDDTDFETLAGGAILVTERGS